MVKFSKKIHTKMDLIKIFLGFIEYNLLGNHFNKDSLIVLNYHGVPSKFLNNFEYQIDYLKKEFYIISPNDLNRFYSTNWKTKKPKVLITFDDCTKNILNAISILEENKIKALLFVIPNYINSLDNKIYYTKYIRPIINEEIENKSEDFNSLNWNDLKTLIDKKNAVGSHTLSHRMDKNNLNLDNHKEIIDSKKIIEEQLNIEINSFCSINNSLKSLNENAARKIKKIYKFHFTTISGYNLSKNNLSIKRINVEAHWTKYQFLFALGKIDNLRWRRKRKQIDFLMTS